jgi:hypothetical protein
MGNQLKKVFLLMALLLCCHPLPQPKPEPEPKPKEPVKVIARDDFNSASALFTRGQNSGNFSGIADGKYNLNGSTNEAAWIYSEQFGLDSLIAFRASVSVSADFYIGVSPSINPNSTRAIFEEPRRLLFYVYRKTDGSYAFHEKFSNVSPKEFDPVTSVVPLQNCYLSFAIDSTRSIAMLYSADGNTYSEISRESIAAWNSVYFVISAWRTPAHGTASIDWAEIECWSNADTIKPPPPKYRKAILEWDSNNESDLLGYNVYVLLAGMLQSFFTQDTVAQFDSLNTGQYNFYITALDSARNESVQSDTVSFE